MTPATAEERRSEALDHALQRVLFGRQFGKPGLDHVADRDDPDKPPAETEGGDELAPGIVDVRSGAEGNSLDGTPYGEW